MLPRQDWNTAKDNLQCRQQISLRIYYEYTSLIKGPLTCQLQAKCVLTWIDDATLIQWAISSFNQRDATYCNSGKPLFNHRTRKSACVMSYATIFWCLPLHLKTWKRPVQDSRQCVILHTYLSFKKISTSKCAELEHVHKENHPLKNA